MTYNELSETIKNKKLKLYISYPCLNLKNEGPITVTEIRLHENPITKASCISLIFSPRQIMVALNSYSMITIDSKHIKDINDNGNEIIINYKDEEEFKIEIIN